MSLAGIYHSGWPTTPVIGRGGRRRGRRIEVNRSWAPATRPTIHPTPFRYAPASSSQPADGELTPFLEILNLTNRKNVCCTEDSTSFETGGTVTVIPEERYWAPIIPTRIRLAVLSRTAPAKDKGYYRLIKSTSLAEGFCRPRDDTYLHVPNWRRHKANRVDRASLHRRPKTCCPHRQGRRKGIRPLCRRVLSAGYTALPSRGSAATRKRPRTLSRTPFPTHPEKSTAIAAKRPSSPGCARSAAMRSPRIGGSGHDGRPRSS